MYVCVCAFITKRDILQCHLFLPPLRATEPLPLMGMRDMVDTTKTMKTTTTKNDNENNDNENNDNENNDNKNNENENNDNY